MPFAIKVILELGAIFALLYGFYHEKEVIAFEDRLLAAFRSGREQKKVQQHTAVPEYPVEETSYDEREARALEAEANRRAAAALKAAEERKAARKQAAQQNAQRKAYAQDASFVA